VYDFAKDSAPDPAATAARFARMPDKNLRMTLEVAPRTEALEQTRDLACSCGIDGSGNAAASCSAGGETTLNAFALTPSQEADCAHAQDKFRNRTWFRHADLFVLVLTILALTVSPLTILAPYEERS
jgi:hypothetical protein